MYLLTVYFPLISFLVCYFSGRRLGFKGVSFISIFNMSLLVLSVLYSFYEIILTNYSCWITSFNWIDIGKFRIIFSYQFDALTAIMLLMISLISTIVHIYSLSYMQQDLKRNKFISLLSLFTFFMLILVTAGNFLQLLLGWEGVGIRSYLLVNFWSDRIAANKAALKALFFNRVGDFGMILASVTIFDAFKTLNFKLIFDLTPLLIDDFYLLGSIYIYKIDLICSFIVLAAIAKSAQFFLHGWLSDAMEGPTPVSALIHAATMVTAGIFLLARFSPILQYSHVVLNFIIIFGAITTLLFSFSGQNTNDLKKIVASSTASQLAYMFFISGLLDNEGSIFHLFLHAFFKALLFLSAGSIIHSLGDQQDIRKMGGLFLLMPFNTFCFSIGSLSLVGLPAATGGYYSKDPILEDTFLIDSYFDDFLNLSSELGVLNTLYYNMKLIRIVFFGSYKGSKFFDIHNVSKNIMLSLFFLTILSFSAPFLWEFIISEDNMISQTFTEMTNFFREGDLNYYREEETTLFLFWLLILICIFGSIHSEEMFFETSDSSKFSVYFYSYFDEIFSNDNLRWGVEYFLTKKLVSITYNLSDFFFLSIDRGLLEFFGPFSIISKSKLLFQYFHKLQSGFLYHYIFVYFISIIFYIILIHTFFFPNYLIEIVFFLLMYLFVKYLIVYFGVNLLQNFKNENLSQISLVKILLKIIIKFYEKILCMFIFFSNFFLLNYTSLFLKNIYKSKYFSFFKRIFIASMFSNRSITLAYYILFVLSYHIFC